MKNRIVNLLAFVIMASTSTIAQDYNFGFENWTDHGNFEEPDYWGTFNPVTIVGVQALKDSDAVVGDYALKLSTAAIPAGIAVLGTINPASGKITPGRPYTQRPEKVALYYKTVLVNGDSSAVVFTLSKFDAVGDSTITVALAAMLFRQDVTEWTYLELPFEYYSTETPDTLAVILAATANADGFGNAGCELYVDDIRLEFPVGITAANNIEEFLQIFPNPATEAVNISYKGNSKNLSVKVYDNNGSLMYSEKLNASTQSISVSHFSKGIYHVKITDGKSVKHSGSFLKP